MVSSIPMYSNTSVLSACTSQSGQLHSSITLIHTSKGTKWQSYLTMHHRTYIRLNGTSHDESDISGTNYLALYGYCIINYMALHAI